MAQLDASTTNSRNPDLDGLILADESALDRDDVREAYGKYFMGRTVADIMEEWSEHHDEWR